MYSLVNTCIRPKAESIDDSSYKIDFHPMKCLDSSSLQKGSESSYDNASRENKIEQMENTNSHSASLVQSPSRENRTIPCKIDPDVDDHVKLSTPKQFYSPLYEHSSALSHKSNATQSKGKSKHELQLMSRLKDLMTHSQRWKFQSDLAGSHAIPIHVLDLSRRDVSKETLKYGITPQTALAITDLTFHENILSKYNLPSLLDTIVELFPNLEHLTFASSEDRATHYDREENEEDDDGIVYSADDLDTTFSPTSPPETSLLTIEPSNIITAVAKHNKEEEEFMKRLYMLYRIPKLKSVNRIPVRENEYRLASPKTVKKQTGSPRKILDLKAESRLIIFHADDLMNDDCKLSTLGVEMTLNQHLCSKSTPIKSNSVEYEIDGMNSMLGQIEDLRTLEDAMISDSITPLSSTVDDAEIHHRRLNLEAIENLSSISNGGCGIIHFKEAVENTQTQNSPSSMLPNKSTFSSAGLLLANMKIFEGKENQCKSSGTLQDDQTGNDSVNTKSNASNIHIIQSTADIKKKLLQHNNRKRSSRPPPSPASMIRPKSEGRLFITPNVKGNTRTVPIVPLVSLFDEESSDEEEE